MIAVNYYFNEYSKNYLYSRKGQYSKNILGHHVGFGSIRQLKMLKHMSEWGNPGSVLSITWFSEHSTKRAPRAGMPSLQIDWFSMHHQSIVHECSHMNTCTHSQRCVQNLKHIGKLGHSIYLSTFKLSIAADGCFWKTLNCFWCKLLFQAISSLQIEAL